MRSIIDTSDDPYVTISFPDRCFSRIHYNAKAVENNGTVVGIKCKDGIVMGLEKPTCRKMMLSDAVHRGAGMGLEMPACRKMMLSDAVHRGAGMAVAGLGADVGAIFTRVKSEAVRYEKVYREPIPVKELAERVAGYVHFTTLHWWGRPFGSGVILGGYNRGAPELYMIEPSGLSYRYFGAAIGKGKEAATKQIEKLNPSEMTCREGVLEVAKIIYEVNAEVTDGDFELELSWVCDESKRLHMKVPDELLEEAKSAARNMLLSVKGYHWEIDHKGPSPSIFQFHDDLPC
ncbi:unnamed protein product [Linum tenue]|uniref:Uncharacterized protein n=1 Tax=Linum tenue TaxID=586396 RepID=A0AAV0QC58_9ROSI|nr:unnamed protein product [Linum tenue]